MKKSLEGDRERRMYYRCHIERTRRKRNVLEQARENIYVVMCDIERKKI
jgi:hypothetical protein